MTDKLAIGDIVQLKSGGPRMTVISPQSIYGYDSHESVKCAWFNGATKTDELFAADSLTKVERL